MHPLDELLRWFPDSDFAVLEHRFATHGRDYSVTVEVSLCSNNGRHEIVFTHCVQADCETRVADKIWPESWSDEFIDYEKWVSAKEPDGYVWGTNWSLAYPGIQSIQESAIANEWSRRLSKPMFEATLETDRFFLRLVFHSIRSRKIDDRTDTISQAVFPIK
jgi:hypothetical protein